MSWDGVPSTLPRTDKLRSLVVQGIPHSFRPQIWMRLAGELVQENYYNSAFRSDWLGQFSSAPRLWVVSTVSFMLHVPSRHTHLLG